MRSLLLLILQLQLQLLNLNEGDRRVMTCTKVDDRQLLSTKKLFKKSTNVSIMSDRQLLTCFIVEPVGISIISVHLIQGIC